MSAKSSLAQFSTMRFMFQFICPVSCPFSYFKSGWLCGVESTVETISSCVCVYVSEGEGQCLLCVLEFQWAERVGQYLLNRNQILLILPYPQKRPPRQHWTFVCMHSCVTMCCAHLCACVTFNLCFCNSRLTHQHQGFWNGSTHRARCQMG